MLGQPLAPVTTQLLYAGMPNLELSHEDCAHSLVDSALRRCHHRLQIVCLDALTKLQCATWIAALEEETIVQQVASKRLYHAKSQILQVPRVLPAV